MNYFYTYACHEDEAELCRLELRTLLGAEPEKGFILSPRCVDPGRSPFLKERIECRVEGSNLDDLADHAGRVEWGGRTFKLNCVKQGDGLVYEARKEAERLVGWRIAGKAEMKAPDIHLGMACAAGRWILGKAAASDSPWHGHRDKPRQYSTALSAKVARAAVNIAVPEPERVLRAADPCCGIGTVLLEAASMGIPMDGFDINPSAVWGAKKNLAHYGYPDTVRLMDMRKIEEAYDAAILDLPYNLCSVLSELELASMLGSARRLAPRVLVISSEDVEHDLAEAGFDIRDGCKIHKGSFTRHLWVCV